MIQKLPHEHINSKMADVISKKMPDRENFQIAADIFKLLDDPNRLQIFWVLCHVEACVINLAAILNTSSPNLSHHLKILMDSGLIVRRREGKEVYYKAANTNEANMLHKALEQIMRISCPERQARACESCRSQEGMTETERIVEQVHTYLAANLDKRITIEALSHRFLINPTTLKAGFKDMYGTSIAAHIKEHRLEKAAKLLIETELSVAEIAKSVGYASQSKFSGAFFEKYQILPLEYRKRNAMMR